MKNNGEKMKKLKTVLLGAGNRGLVYADYALSNPDELEIIGVIEVNKDNRKEAKNRYSLNDDAVFDVFILKPFYASPRRTLSGGAWNGTMPLLRAMENT